MSAKLVGAIWDLDLPHPQLWVLMAFADHADHTGGDVYASVGLIVWKTGYSESQVHRIVRELLNSGVLVRENRKPGGRGHPNRYRIDLDAAPHKEPFMAPQKGVTVTPLKGSHGDTLYDTERVSPESEKGAKRVSGLTRAQNTQRTIEPIEPGETRARPAPITPAQNEKVLAFLDDVSGRGMPTVLGGSDKTAIIESDADAPTCAAAYAALIAHEWGDDWLWRNASVANAVRQINKYLTRCYSPPPPDANAQEYLDRRIREVASGLTNAEATRLLGGS
jgi:hypothetical protein